MNVKAQLLELAEPSYQRFSSRLLPGTPDILGVRLPVLRLSLIHISEPTRPY